MLIGTWYRLLVSCTTFFHEKHWSRLLKVIIVIGFKTGSVRVAIEIIIIPLFGIYADDDDDLNKDTDCDSTVNCPILTIC